MRGHNLVKPNYQFEKRQRELEKKRKQEEKRLRDLARSVDSSLDEGVYCQFRGPHYETPAEVQMAKIIGGHIVGMSTALEAIAARQAGMEILGMSLITNLAAGIQKTPLSHAEVIEAGREAESRISALLATIVGEL